MGYMCPLCNGFRQLEHRCPKCGHYSEDMGKVTDYFGPYSAYMEIDGLKQIDGIMTTLSEHECPHLFYCEACDYEELSLIKE